jgi:hypothetical protein
MVDAHLHREVRTERNHPKNGSQNRSLAHGGTVLNSPDLRRKGASSAERTSDD